MPSVVCSYLEKPGGGYKIKRAQNLGGICLKPGAQRRKEMKKQAAQSKSRNCENPRDCIRAETAPQKEAVDAHRGQPNKRLLTRSVRGYQTRV